MAAKPERRYKIAAENRKARFHYEIGEVFEAGIALTGTEVKSLRGGKATIAESYADAREGEIWLINSNIPEYLQASRFNHAPKRPRKLLLHKHQINRLAGAVEREGMTIVPLKLYFNDKGRAKVEIALARGQEAARQARNRPQAVLGARARPAAAGERADHAFAGPARSLRDPCQRLAALEHVLSATSLARLWSSGRRGFSYRFGDKQLNVHGPGVKPAEVARLPVQPGNSDLCFEWSGPIADAIAHLQAHGIAIERGPLLRFGAKGQGTSVYFRDPDGSLMEFMSYKDVPS